MDLMLHTWEEVDFLREVVDQTGCGLLLDVNNLYVSAINLGFDTTNYLNLVPLDKIAEIHLAGHSVDPLPNGDMLLLDDHGAEVDVSVWQLYAQVNGPTGPKATLIEWDTNIPEWQTLRAEANKARKLLKQRSLHLGSEV
jgi:uncharacterized protein